MTTISSSNIYGANSVSPVQQVLNAVKNASSSTSSSSKSGSGPSASNPTDYQDQDWFIRAKVAQLKSQLALYQAVPGLDPDGSIQDNITAQANKLIAQQSAKIKAAQDEAAAKQAELAKQTADAALAAKIPSVDILLARAKSRANGETLGAYTPPKTTSSSSNGDQNVISSDQMLANAKTKSSRGNGVDTNA